MSTFVSKQESAGFRDSQGINAQFNLPSQFVYSNKENSFLVADYANHVIRKVSLEGNKIKVGFPQELNFHNLFQGMFQYLLEENRLQKMEP